MFVNHYSHIFLKGIRMKLIKKFAYKSANYIQKSNKTTNENKRILYFGFQAIYGDLVKMIIVICISLLLQSLLPVLTLTLAFALLRRYAGGFHMDTEGKCILATVSSFILVGTIIGKINIQLNVFLIIALNTIAFIICLILLIKYSPRDCINRPIDDSEAIVFKNKSIRDLILLILISIFLAFIGQPILSISIIAGIVIEIFTLVPIGYRLFGLLN